MRIAGGTAKRITKRIINFILVMSVSGLIYPGICLIVCCAGFNLLGEGLRDCSLCLT